MSKSFASPPAPSPEANQVASGSQWNWKAAISLCWSIGFLLLLLRLAMARALLWRLERTAMVARDLRGTELHDHAALVTVFHEATAQLGIKQPVKLLIHSQKTIPVVWVSSGRACCCRQSRVSGPDEQLRSVLLHELAHIQRRDTVSNCWLRSHVPCIGSIHWPAAAWRLHVERERACDDLSW